MSKELEIIPKYTLNDIDNVLSNILEKEETKQILNDFKVYYKKSNLNKNETKDSFVLPVKWRILRNPINHTIINSYFNSKYDHVYRDKHSYICNFNARYNLSPEESKGDYLTHTKFMSEATEITFEQFLDYVYLPYLEQLKEIENEKIQTEKVLPW